MYLRSWICNVPPHWSVSVDCLWIIPSPVGVIQIIPGFVGEQYLGGVHDAARQAMSVDCAQY